MAGWGAIALANLKSAQACRTDGQGPFEVAPDRPGVLRRVRGLMTTACIHILLPARCRSPAETDAGAVGVLMWCPGALEGGIENGGPPQPAQLGQVVLHSIPILFPRFVHGISLER